MRPPALPWGAAFFGESGHWLDMDFARIFYI